MDDIFIVWHGSLNLFSEFFTILSTNDYNLSFTMDSGSTKISFLDVEVMVQEDGMLSSDLYRKPTAGNSILRYESAHPVSLRRSIPFEQYLHLRRICSDEGTFKIRAGELQSRLSKRGYTRSLLKKAYK